MNKNAHIIWTEEICTDDYSYDSKINSLPLVDLDVYTQEELLSVIMDTFGSQVIKKVLAVHQFFTPDEIKEQKGIQICNKDRIFLHYGYSLEEASLDKPIPDSFLSKINAYGLFTRISTPPSVTKQIEDYLARQEKKKQETEAQKLARKVRKAQKTIKDAEKLLRDAAK